jgi:hypothetical protein
VFEDGLFSAAPSRLRSGWTQRAWSLGISLAAHAVSLVLLVTFVVYYFINWKYLASVWQLS